MQRICLVEAASAAGVGQWAGRFSRAMQLVDFAPSLTSEDCGKRRER
jgi:hypothetical protein